MSTEIAISGEVLNMSAKIDLADILTIVASRAEQTYQDKIGESKAECAKLENQRQENTKALEALTAKTAVSARQKDMRKLQSALSGIDSEVEIEIEHKLCFKDKDAYISTTLVLLKNKREIARLGNMSHTLPPAYLELQKELTRVDELILEKQNELLGWRRKLSEIPQLERKYKAKLVEHKLKSVTGGQDVLDTLTAELEKDLLKLPVK
jgi:hypothetical protein